jgi:hypothetical protein
MIIIAINCFDMEARLKDDEELMGLLDVAETVPKDFL